MKDFIKLQHTPINALGIEDVRIPEGANYGFDDELILKDGNYKLRFPESYWEYIKENFNDYALLFNNLKGSDFTDIIRSACGSIGINPIIKPVGYCDYDSGSATWITPEYIDMNDTKHFFKKRQIFSKLISVDALREWSIPGDLQR